MTLDIEEKLRLLQTGPTEPKRPLKQRKRTTKESVTTPPSTTMPSKTSFEMLLQPPEEEALDVVFKANPGPQEDFLAAGEPEVLFGGAAGGEPKSWFSASFLQ